MKRLLTLAATLVGIFQVNAADLPPAAEERPTVVLATSPTFSFTGYGWASALPAANVDLSFGDILKELNGALMGAAETRQALGTVDDRLRDTWGFHAGYRALHVDDRKDDFLCDTTMHGPIVAATYRFWAIGGNDVSA